ncbi:MAG: hypothetical protein IPL61_25830 [Myxococcales bacterium]|nr:hypothetical protein [Myxococcales bacterium]
MRCSPLALLVPLALGAAAQMINRRWAMTGARSTAAALTRRRSIRWRARAR